MKISILIPAFNEFSKTILKVLNNISKVINNIDHQFQIIIINDGSTDDTDKILLENKNLYDEYLKLEKIQVKVTL